MPQVKWCLLFIAVLGLPALAKPKGPARLVFAEIPSLDFGKHNVGEVVEKEIVIKNVGGAKATRLHGEVNGNFVFRFKGRNYPGVGGTCGEELEAEEGKNQCTLVVEGSVIWPYEKQGQVAVQYQNGRISRDLVISGHGNQKAPIAIASSVQTEEDKPVVGSFEASDPDGDSLAYLILQEGKKGRIEVLDSEKGTYQYFPNLDETGTDTILYKVSDGDLESKPTRITVVITPVNDAPRAQDMEFTTEVEKPYSSALSATDVENDRLTYQIIQNGSLGTATITDATTGTFTYIPNAGVPGQDEFVFQASDGKNYSDKATVRITIVPHRGMPLTEEQSPVNPDRGLTGDPETNPGP